MVQFCGPIIFNKKLPLYHTYLNIFLIDLPIDDLPFFNNSLNNLNLGIGVILDAFLLVLLNGHVKRDIFVEEVFFDEDAGRREGF